MGQDPTDEELFDMIAEVDSDGSGEIGTFAEIGVLTKESQILSSLAQIFTECVSLQISLSSSRS